MLILLAAMFSAQWKWFSGERKPISGNKKKTFHFLHPFPHFLVRASSFVWVDIAGILCKKFSTCVLCSMLSDVLLFRKIGNEHKQNNRCRTAAAKTEKWEIKRKKKDYKYVKENFLTSFDFIFFLYFSFLHRLYVYLISLIYSVQSLILFGVQLGISCVRSS